MSPFEDLEISKTGLHPRTTWLEQELAAAGFFFGCRFELPEPAFGSRRLGP